MRRLLAGTTAFVAFSGTLLVVPVYAEPTPEAVPVETSVEEVALGSFEKPTAEADVQQGTTEPVAGVADTAPALTVTRTGVDEFSLVGVTWAHDPAVTDVRVQVRVQDSEGAWGSWTEVGSEDLGQDAGQAQPAAERRSGTSPLWTGPSTGVEVEVVNRSGAAPTDVQLDLVDPGESAADGALGSPDIQDTADAALAMPHVYSRAQWGADESLRTWAPQYASTIKAATLHHTADTNNYSADQVPVMMRAIYRYHAVSLKWGDIGYNVLVDKYGRLWEGRSGGLASTVIGAHAGGFNTSTFGVSMIGNYDVVDTPQPMVDAVAAIIGWKFSLYNVNPNGTATLTSGGTDKYAAGRTATLPTIHGHRDTKSTACPGRYGYARLGEIRSKVTAALSRPQFPITDRYNADATLRSMLGAPLTGEWKTGGGTGHYQNFQNGALYWSPATGVRALFGESYQKFKQLGYEQGPLGWPTSDQLPTSGYTGVYNAFTNGAIYRSAATGAHALVGPIHQKWVSLGWETGAMGWPTSDLVPVGDGRGQYTTFQRGSIYWTQATGAHTVSGAVGDHWRARGAQAGALGYPTTDQLPTSTGRAQYTFFENGAVYASPATGVRALDGEVFRKWASLGYETGPMGLPTSDTIGIRDGKGRFATFEGGAVYWSPASGAHTLSGRIHQRWVQQGWEGGPLGYPTTDQLPTAGRTAIYTFFQGGAIYDSAATGVRVVEGPVLSKWASLGYEQGQLGLPTADRRPVGDGRGTYTEFQKGAVYSTPTTGTRALAGEVHAAWTRTGGVTGDLGYPTSDPLPTLRRDATYTVFERGVVYATPDGAVRTLVGDFHRRWAELGHEHGYLGYPTSDRLPTSGGTGLYQTFQGGALYWSATTGLRALRGEIHAHWASLGWEHGPLGFPTTDELSTRYGDGRYTLFQNGAVYWTAATGPRAMVGAVHEAWVAQGWEHGRLGYPTGDAQTVAGGTRQQFQHGRIEVSAATGVATVHVN